MDKNEKQQFGPTQPQTPGIEPEQILVSTQTPLLLENPLTQMQINDPATFSTLHEKIGTDEGGTFTVSLDDVQAHPFAQADLTDDLPAPVSAPSPVSGQTAQAEPEDLLAARVKPETPIPPQTVASKQPDAPALQPQEKVIPVLQPQKTVQPVPSAHPEDAKPASKQVVPPPNTPNTPPEKPHKRKRWWLWVVAALALLFLVTIGGVVPVENIPILRNLAHAMGFTPQQAKQMSFLRALLTWTDKTLGLNGRLSTAPQAGESRLFSSREDLEGAENLSEEEKAALQGKMARYGGKSSLIDMRALNELQRSKGRKQDQLAGTVLLLPGQKAQTRASMRDTDVTVRTEANRDKSEVYFGSDASAINREFNDGYDSVKTLKKIPNPYITDGHPIDFFMQMTNRMMKIDAGLAGIDKELGTSVVGWRTGPGDVGDNKPLRDLYHAWITSRMSNYTTSIMLKKTLADASFLGAAIPTQASDSLTFGGVRIDSDSLEGDQEGWKEYLEFEKKCKEDLMYGGGQKVKEAVTNFNKIFYDGPEHLVAQNYNVGFPQSCKEWVDGGKKDYSSSNFGQHLATIQQECQNAQSGYSSLAHTCLMAVEYKDRCHPTTLANYQGAYDAFTDYCKTECDKEEAAHNEAHKGEENPPAFDRAECNSRVDATHTWSYGGKEWDSEKMEENVLAKVGATADYFPQITKGNTEGGNEAQAYEDSGLWVTKTIVQGIEQNSTRKSK